MKRSQTLEYALNYVTIFKEIGLCIVPDKPSPEMLTAGAKVGNINVGDAWKIYHAMLKAEEKREEEEFNTPD